MWNLIDYEDPMEHSSQEIYSILAEEVVITSTRVLMGGANSIAHVQVTVQAMFADIYNNGLLIWIDDVLEYADTAEGLIELLRKVLTIYVKRGLKLNPRKCSFFLREGKWFEISSIANFWTTALAVRLRSKLGENKVYTAGGDRKKSNVRGVQLANIGWGAEEGQCLEACRVALQNTLQLAHPDPKKRLCVFADASDLHWGCCYYSGTNGTPQPGLYEQHHEPLMMISGTFSGSAKQKEAYAIVETCKRADVLVQRADGFLLFTDHRNLRFIFAPTTVLASVSKYTTDKSHI
ncbi:hypothetical protein PHMEG_00025968 [Phytophthora megakarya]|uniref:Reverse transcriptase domain-containing protein n=1 Tax=Phytophthora megakarya TaxID=4795 RepID=A0A225VAU6_9STRA|nr:hypothetical protein PHMEG_00025968 [Phytophthora megakarya]